MSEGTEREMALSLVIPAYNEERGIRAVLDESRAVLEGFGVRWEIIVVDDHSEDRTAEIALGAGVTVVRNAQNGGYGYSLMRGIERARFPTIAIVDADGSYPVEQLAPLFEEYCRGIPMVVGHRRGEHYSSTTRMRVLRWLFTRLTEFIVGRSVPDVNSGMRIFERDAVLPLFRHMSYGFSFTTSITLLFMMRALSVSYVPIEYRARTGTSKVRYLRDVLRALQIIASITARLNPIKLFLMAAVANVLLLLPLVAVLGLWGDVRTLLVIVIETSALLVGLGFLVEALVDKSLFEKPPGDTGPESS
jgi:glycosyltransferase involved in cell wall biosynthesis